MYVSGKTESICEMTLAVSEHFQATLALPSVAPSHMSLALGRTSNYTKFTLYSKLHPDNLNPRETIPLPVPVRGPAAIGSFTPFEKAVNPQSAWGHKLTAESPFGPMETRTRLKVDVAPKIGAGGGWQKTVMTEKAQSTMCSAMYAGSQIQMSCCEAADRVRPPRSCARTHAARAHLRPWSCTSFEEIELRSEGYCKAATFRAYHDSRARVRPVRHRGWAASNSPEVAKSRHVFRKSSSRFARDTGGKREMRDRERHQNTHWWHQCVESVRSLSACSPNATVAGIASKK